MNDGIYNSYIVSLSGFKNTVSRSEISAVIRRDIDDNPFVFHTGFYEILLHYIDN